MSYLTTCVGRQTDAVLPVVSAVYSVAPPDIVAGPLVLEINTEWPPACPATGSLYSDVTSPALPAHFDTHTPAYVSQQNSPTSYVGSYVSPAALHGSVPSGVDFYPWACVSTTRLAGEPGPSDEPSEPTVAVLKLVDSGSSEVEPKEGLLTSETVAYVDISGGTHVQPQPQLQLPDQLEAPQGATLRSKRTKRTPAPEAVAACRSSSESGRRTSTTRTRTTTTFSAVAGSGAGGEARRQNSLRSPPRPAQSRANLKSEPPEERKERKTRSSHNLIEKQYRNRLNAQFKNLLKTLPATLRSPGGTCIPDTPNQPLNLGDRRPSKGEVLDMSATYIRTLERDRGRLEKEREQLLRDVERLSSMVKSNEASNLQGSTG